ncbi:MAG TPA: hypothetical protein PKE12_00265 [Kiritimatiellia bacterium]|nr:hypothetical protein [Kiritimatiellia bacterium]
MDLALPKESDGKSRERWAIRGLLGATLLLQLGFFLRHVDSPVLYRDEANDVFTARSSWGDLLRHFISDWDPYVWILALKGWTAIWGTSELAARSICWASMSCSVLLFFSVCRRWTRDPLIAASASVLLGLGTPMMMTSIGYARPYALSLLCSVWMLDRCLAFREGPTVRRYILFAVAALAFGNIQPVNYGMAAGLCVLILWERFSAPRTSRAWWRSAALLLLILGAAASPSLLQSLRFGSVDTGLSAVDPQQLGVRFFAALSWKWLGSVCAAVPGVITTAFDDHPAGFFQGLRAGQGRWIGVLVAAIWMGVIWRYARRMRSAGQCQHLVLAAILVAAPLLILGIGSLRVDRLTSPIRAYAAYGPGLCLLLVLLVRPWRILVWALPVLTLSRMAAVLLFLQDASIAHRSDAKAATAWMDDVRASDLVLLANPAIGPTFHYYYRGPSTEQVLPYDGPVLYWHDMQLWRDLHDPGMEDRVSAKVLEASRKGERVWFLWGGTPLGEDPLRWHPYYAPRAFMAARRVLDERFVKVRSADFTKTMEPFHVALYEPLEGSAP